MPMYLYIINIIVLLVLYVCSYSCVHFIVQEVKVKVVHCHDRRLPLEARKNACMDCASDDFGKPETHRALSKQLKHLTTTNCIIIHHIG